VSADGFLIATGLDESQATILLVEAIDGPNNVFSLRLPKVDGSDVPHRLCRGNGNFMEMVPKSEADDSCKFIYFQIDGGGDLFAVMSDNKKYWKRLQSPGGKEVAIAAMGTDAYHGNQKLCHFSYKLVS
jgi:hypothetical protein